MAAKADWQGENMIEHNANQASSIFDAMQLINKYINTELPKVYNPSYSIFKCNDKKYLYITFEQDIYDGMQHEQSYKIGLEEKGKILFHDIERSVNEFKQYIDARKNDKYFKLKLLFNTPQFLAYKL